MMQETPEVIASRSMQRTYRKEIWRKVLLAVRKYDLIQENDHVAVCVSGGKDSLALAVCMRDLSKYGRVPFKVSYLAMDPGYTPENREKMIENARVLGLELTVFDSPIFEAVETAPKSPCHVCAAMRRGYLYKEARKLGCNKIALGHHLDDAVETILMSQLYGGEYKTMMPFLNSKNYEGMQLIRPMYLVREKDIVNWARYLHIDTLRCACRVTRSEDGGKRKEIKELIHMLEKRNSGVVWNILHGIERVNLETVLGYRYTTHGDVHTLIGKTVDESETNI
ncbi:MAG: tRNA 2-thiocytidine biosynthesis protein TtcA [Clostridia bacterium]|nr:tRNA 2-thiocytidine biosynthesis protein TtcA [Clostridia bacterium]